MAKTYPPLTAYRIIVEYADGHRESYDTNCAADIDLSAAQAYFMGQRQEVTETTFRTVVGVEQIIGPAQKAK